MELYLRLRAQTLRGFFDRPRAPEQTMLRGFIFLWGSQPCPYGENPEQSVGEGLCSSRNLLTLCLKTSYNTPKSTPRRPREKGHPPRKNVFLFF